MSIKLVRMNLQIRINDLLAEKGAKPAHLASATGATRATVSDWVHGKTKSISPEYLFSAAHFFGVNELWLSTEKGPKYKSDARSESLLTGNNPSGIVEPSTEYGGRNEGYLYVRSYEMLRGEVAEEIRPMTVPASLLVTLGIDASQLANIKMPDDSQADRIRKGDLIAINLAWSGNIKNDTLYAVKIGDSYTLRLTAVQANKSVILRCKNGNYPDENIPEDDIAGLDILGEYVCFFGR